MQFIVVPDVFFCYGVAQGSARAKSTGKWSEMRVESHEEKQTETITYQQVRVMEPRAGRGSGRARSAGLERRYYSAPQPLFRANPPLKQSRSRCS